MLSFNEFRKVVISEADDKKVEDELLSVIDQLIDSWISSIKNDILTGAQSFAASRGLWDRFKNFISNIFHGYANQKNPYYAINALGYLGSDVDVPRPATATPTSDKQPKKKPQGSKTKPKPFKRPKKKPTEGWQYEHTHISLENYKNLKQICEKIENQVTKDSSKMNIIQIIDKHGDLLKDAMRKILQPVFQKLSQVASSQSEFKPPEPPQPIEPSQPPKPPTPTQPSGSTSVQSMEKEADTAEEEAEKKVSKTKSAPPGKEAKEKIRQLLASEPFEKPTPMQPVEGTPPPAQEPKPVDPSMSRKEQQIIDTFPDIQLYKFMLDAGIETKYTKPIIERHLEKIKDKQKFDVNEIIRGSVQIFNPVFLDIAKFIDEKFGSNLKNWTEKDLKDCYKPENIQNISWTFKIIKPSYKDVVFMDNGKLVPISSNEGFVSKEEIENILQEADISKDKVELVFDASKTYSSEQIESFAKHSEYLFDRRKLSSVESRKKAHFEVKGDKIVIKLLPIYVKKDDSTFSSVIPAAPYRSVMAVISFLQCPLWFMGVIDNEGKHKWVRNPLFKLVRDGKNPTESVNYASPKNTRHDYLTDHLLKCETLDNYSAFVMSLNLHHRSKVDEFDAYLKRKFKDYFPAD